jgi:hypothetical protein
VISPIAGNVSKIAEIILQIDGEVFAMAEITSAIGGTTYTTCFSMVTFRCFPDTFGKMADIAGRTVPDTFPTEITRGRNYVILREKPDPQIMKESNCATQNRHGKFGLHDTCFFGGNLRAHHFDFTLCRLIKFQSHAFFELDNPIAPKGEKAVMKYLVSLLRQHAYTLFRRHPQRGPPTLFLFENRHHSGINRI